MNIKNLIDDFEAARILGLSRRQLNELVRRQKIPHIPLPTGDIRFDAHDLAAWAQSLKRPVRGERYQ